MTADDTEIRIHGDLQFKAISKEDKGNQRRTFMDGVHEIVEGRFGREYRLPITFCMNVPLLPGKFFAFRYFFEYELPKIEGLARRLMNSDGLTVEMKPDYFSD